jgi:hypothetical protein
VAAEVERVLARELWRVIARGERVRAGGAGRVAAEAEGEGARERAAREGRVVAAEAGERVRADCASDELERLALWRAREH